MLQPIYSTRMKADDSNNYLYNKNLKSLARKLRKNMTKAEVMLWKYALKSGKRRGYTFNRQRPVLNYIVDFMCKQLKLIIEVDGISHHHDIIYKNDEKRLRTLEEAGFTVIRFMDEDVLNDLESVILEIDRAIAALVSEADS